MTPGEKSEFDKIRTAEIRQIVREEMKNLMVSIQQNTYASGDGDLEYAANMAISNAAHRESERLPHDWNCQLREGRWVWKNCTCSLNTKET